MIALKMMGVHLFGSTCNKICINVNQMTSSRIFTFKNVIQRTASSVTTSRRKREDFSQIPYHYIFSPWKTIIGASDWKDYSPGKEKYRRQNLPSYACSGLYELGVATSASAAVTRAIVIPVYLGQAENVRARIQKYGRHGAHLESSFLLFSDIFSRGCPIVYRWAPMKSKEEAERIEEELLGKYDYGWNKRNNGHLCPQQIHMKLAALSGSTCTSLIKDF